MSAYQVHVFTYDELIYGHYVTYYGQKELSTT